MGGRSKQSNKQQDAYSFVSTLSDKRLNNYGIYSSSGVQNNNDSNITRTGKPTDTSQLNKHVAAEFKKRNGFSPTWDLEINGGVRHHKEYK